MPYTHFRYIAYEVPTAALYPSYKEGAARAGYGVGTPPPLVKRVKVPTPPSGKFHDAYARLRRLAAILDMAKTFVDALGGDTTTTLKVFMVPEFYLRPEKSTGEHLSNTYPRAEVNYILEAMRTMFRHGDFRNWLIIPGTVLWNTKDDGQDTPFFRNTMVHVQGGARDTFGIIEKNQPSGKDGLPIEGALLLDEGYRAFHKSWKNRKRNVFSTQNLSIGAEICLDHKYTPRFDPKDNKFPLRTLRYLLKDWKQKAKQTEPDLQLHLLPCAGMPINSLCVSAMVGGFILRNDGLAVGDKTPRSEYRKVHGFYTKSPLKDWRVPYGYTDFADLSGDPPPSVLPIPSGDYAVPDLPAPAYKFPQRIVVYPSQRLP